MRVVSTGESLEHPAQLALVLPLLLVSRKPAVVNVLVRKEVLRSLFLATVAAKRS